MLYFTKEIKEPKIIAAAGTPVPPRYSRNPQALNWFREKYGADVVKDDGFRNSNSFITKAGEELRQLREQVKSLTAENVALKKKLKE